jgi:hypothetical protein
MRPEVVNASLFSEAQLLVERILGDDLGSDASLFSEAMVVAYSTPTHHSPTSLAQQRLRVIIAKVVGLGRALPGRAPGMGASDEAAEQGVEADKAEHNGASQLNSSVGRTLAG